MKMSFLIILSVLFMFSTKGQQLGKETWTEITHEVKQLVLSNEKVQYELESLLFNINQDTVLNIFREYKYFHLNVKNDTACQKLEFWLSNYPYKSEGLIGFFILKGYFVFVHDELPDFLELTEHKKKFSYIEHKLGDLVMMEDDTGCWVIEYKNRQFRLLHYPAKQ